jgi:hypothetical protein
LTTLGIDPGKDGALVLLDGRRPLASALLADLVGTARWEARADVVAGWIRSVHATYRIDRAVMELYAGRAGQGRGSMLTIGVGWGLLRGVCGGLGIPVRVASSARWQADLLNGLPGEGKDRAIAYALQEVPDLDLMPGRRRKPHDGLADAACLAVWGGA